VGVDVGGCKTQLKHMWAESEGLLAS
jgi:hypothetical protein